MIAIKRITFSSVAYSLLFLGSGVPIWANGGSALGGNSQFQSGELGDKAGAATAAALNLPGAKERYEARTKDFSKPDKASEQEKEKDKQKDLSDKSSKNRTVP